MGGEEDDEILVLIFGLQEILGTALIIEGVSNSQDGLGRQFAVRICIDQSLERKPGFYELALLQVFLAGFEKGLIWRHDALLKLRALLTASPQGQQDQKKR